MYKVIEFFTDLQDDAHPYSVGDTFPRKGAKATKKRLTELSGTSNARGIPLIEKVKDLDGEPDTGK